MPISVVCPTCNSRLKAPERVAGAAIKCPKCSNYVPVPATPPADEPRPRRRGCLLVLLALSLVLNCGLVSGYCFLGPATFLDQVPWLRDHLPLAGRSVDSRVEEILIAELKAKNDLADALDKAPGPDQGQAGLDAYGRTMGELSRKYRELKLPGDELKKAVARQAEKHADAVAGADQRVTAALMKLRLGLPDLPDMRLPGPAPKDREMLPKGKEMDLPKPGDVPVKEGAKAPGPKPPDATAWQRESRGRHRPRPRPPAE
jgi:hypothetical protein